MTGAVSNLLRAVDVMYELRTALCFQHLGVAVPKGVGADRWGLRLRRETWSAVKLAILTSLAAALIIAFNAVPASAQSAAILTKTFDPSTVTVGSFGTTTLTVTITNPNGVPLTNVAVSDTFPAGFVRDRVGSVTCGGNGSVGFFTASAFSVSGVTLAAGASCVIPMTGHATATGDLVNTTSTVTADVVPPGAAASATLTSDSPPAAVPVLNEWGLIALSILMGGAALRMARRLPRAREP